MTEPISQAQHTKIFKSCKVDADDFLVKVAQLMLDAGFEPNEIIDAANKIVFNLVKKGVPK
jgi:hypothetical protein